MTGNMRCLFHEKKNKSKKKRNLWIVIPLTIFAVLVFSIGAYVLSFYVKVKNTVDKEMHEPVESIDISKAKKKNWRIWNH